MEFFYYYSLSLFDFRPLTYLDVNFFFDFFSPKKIWPPIFSGAFSHFSPTYIIVGSNHMFQNWLIGKKVAIIFIFLSFVQRKSAFTCIYIYVYTINMIYLILHIGISCRLSMTHQVSD